MRLDSIEPVCEGGRRLLARLKRSSTTLQAAEQATGVSSGYLSKILHGTFPLDSLTLARRIQELYGVPILSWGEPPRVAEGQPAARRPQVQGVRSRRGTRSAPRRVAAS
jgi:transcriptional regulator with XRE-family HTH domain